MLVGYFPILRRVEINSFQTYPTPASNNVNLISSVSCTLPIINFNGGRLPGSTKLTARLTDHLGHDISSVQLYIGLTGLLYYVCTTVVTVVGTTFLIGTAAFLTTSAHSCFNGSVLFALSSLHCCRCYIFMGTAPLSTTLVELHLDGDSSPLYNVGETTS